MTFVGMMRMRYKLEDLFDLQMGKTPARNNPEYWNSTDNKWISIGDLSKCGKYITNTKDYLSDAAVEESGISLIPESTVVMSFKLSIGKTAITSEPMYSNEAIMSFRDKHLVPILPDYLYYMFLAKDWDEGTNKAVMGKTLNKATLAKITIDVHSLAEQKKIVDALDKVASIIDTRQKQLSALDDLIKARFVEMFGDPLNGTAKWPIHTVGDVAEAVDPQPSHRTPPVDTDGIPYVSIKDCDYKTGKINFENARKVSLRVLEEHRNRYTLHDGDFIIGKIGTIGNPIFVPPRDDYTLSANIVLIQPEQSKVSPYYLKYSFMSAYMDRQFEEAKNSTSQAAFGIQKVRQIKIMNPDLAEQYMFEEFCKQIDKSKSVIQKSLDETQLLFDSLMQEYFG